MVKLTINKRNNETENYHKILRGEELDASKHSAREPQQVNICRTNAMRVTINQQLMNKDGYFINMTNHLTGGPPVPLLPRVL